MKPVDIFLSILFILGFVVFIIFIIWFSTCCDDYLNNLRHGINTEYYFLNNLDEFEIVSTSVSYTRFGNPCYNIFTIHIPSKTAYDYQTSLHNYLVLGGKLND